VICKKCRKIYVNWQWFKDSNAPVDKKVFDTQNSLTSCTYLGQRIGEVLRTGHRVGRVLNFFSIRRNWDSHNPSPAGECAPHPIPGEAQSPAGEGLGESQFRRLEKKFSTLPTLCTQENTNKIAFCNLKSRYGIKSEVLPKKNRFLHIRIES